MPQLPSHAFGTAESSVTRGEVEEGTVRADKTSQEHLWCPFKGNIGVVPAWIAKFNKMMGFSTGVFGVGGFPHGSFPK